MRDLAHRVEEAFLAIPDEGFLSDLPFVGTEPTDIADRPVTNDYDRFYRLDPKSIRDNFDDLDQARRELDFARREEVVGRIEDRLNSAIWTGPAADAFRAHMENLGAFYDVQIEFLERAQLGLAAAFKLAVLVREDYLTFGNAMLRAIEKYRRDQEVAEENAELALLGSIVGAVLTVPSPSTVVAAGLYIAATNIGPAVSYGTAHLGATSMEDLGRAYRDQWKQAGQRFDAQCEEISNSFYDLNNRVDETEVPFLEPLPPQYADVHSPDFSYQNFGFAGDDNGAGQRVPAAAQEHAAGGPTVTPFGSSRISRTLG